jgi:hypothetical protein
VPWVSNRESVAATARGLADHMTACTDRYKTTAAALEKLGDKADMATVAAVAAANEAKTAVSDLERRLQKWLIGLLLAVLGTAFANMIHIPSLHFGP